MAINSYTPSLSVAGVSSQNPNSSYYNPLQFNLGKATGDITRLYIKFDLSMFPMEYKIINAMLNIPVVSYSTTNQNRIVIYRVTNAADFASVTWNNMPGFYSYPYYSVPITGNYVTIDITTLVLSWVDGSVPNYGMILLNNEVYFTIATLNTNVYTPSGMNVTITYSSDGGNNFFKSYSFSINSVGNTYISNSFDFSLYKQVTCFIKNSSSSPIKALLEPSPNNVDFVCNGSAIVIEPNTIGVVAACYFGQYIRIRATTTGTSIVGNAWFQVQQ